MNLRCTDIKFNTLENLLDISVYIKILQASSERAKLNDTRSISSSFYWRSVEVHAIIHMNVLRKDSNDMGNKMRGGKKCDFVININVAVTTARCARSRDGIGEPVRDDVKPLRTASMLFSLSVINGKTFLLRFFARDRRKPRDAW